MKIMINGEKNLKFYIPERLFLNQLSATIFPFFINRKLKKHKTKLKGSLCRKFVRELYKAKKFFGKDFEFITVESKNGDLVKIVL